MYIRHKYRHRNQQKTAKLVCGKGESYQSIVFTSEKNKFLASCALHENGRLKKNLHRKIEIVIQ